ncbi:MAG: glycerol-3-phosphate 1-O-acyltransferase PlsY [Bacillota bacterium]|nr:glycerol-3-phosphate 1-O-acyltransferase PlsY [Bacillota bacterium]
MTVFLILVSYLLGSISFGYLVAKRIKGVDIRKLGSGNTGATNISRVIGTKYAVLVLILDALKGLAAILLSSYLSGAMLVILLCGLAVIAGHNWPVFFAFKGGRGGATTLGVFMGLAPAATTVVFTIFILVIIITRYVSLGTIIAAISIPVSMFILHYPTGYIIFGLAVCLILIWKHIPNIKRLIKGKESKWGEKINIP